VTAASLSQKGSAKQGEQSFLKRQKKKMWIVILLVLVTETDERDERTTAV
jgi:hypothetical protein